MSIFQLLPAPADVAHQNVVDVLVELQNLPVGLSETQFEEVDSKVFDQRVSGMVCAQIGEV